MPAHETSLLLASRAWYSAPVSEFVARPPGAILGEVARRTDFAIELDQRDAWLQQIRDLQSALVGLSAHVYLEFNIPRMGKRIDSVLIAGPVVFVIEFKTTAADQSAINQVWDYALDLKNFHAGTHQARVVPLLVTGGAPRQVQASGMAHDLVSEPVVVSPTTLRSALDRELASGGSPPIDPRAWESAPYKPTPTIIEAARALYQHHSVEAIARFDAGAENLAVTSERLREIVRESRAHNRKSLCFVTGVPGAGKTLVGLNVATQRNEDDPSLHAVFLSGNGPLVNVLRAALTRDEYERRKLRGEKPRKGHVGESIKAFIQNVHHFRDDGLQHAGPPSEHVAVFDEAQRAWNLQQTAAFMLRKKRRPDFNQSEPEFLISCMDRHPDWAVVVCLVGGGQEINTGEAGIEAWLDAARERFPGWHLHISEKLTDSEYAAGRALEQVRARPNCTLEPSLHLATSMRSFRADNVAAFVKALLDCDTQAACKALDRTQDRFPIRVTRNLAAAKQWVRARARGTERFGMLCSSRAQRLKPHAIDVRFKVDPVHWFLNGPDDTRSSFYLEDVATEFQVQGLELDWALVNWDADLRFGRGGWSHHDFRGDKWITIHNQANRRYLLNAYRVLLTRARQGMVIFVPPGDSADPTRRPQWYDATFAYLRQAGIAELA
jgi:hypothetical protein